MKSSPSVLSMWNFKFHGALSLRLVASNSPLPQRPQGRAYVLLGPSRHWSCLPRRPFCCSAAPADKDQRAALYSGLFINWRAMSACVSSALGPGSAGAFSRFVLQRKKRDRCLWLGNGLSYTHGRASEGQGLGSAGGEIYFPRSHPHCY